MYWSTRKHRHNTSPCPCCLCACAWISRICEPRVRSRATVACLRCTEPGTALGESIGPRAFGQICAFSTRLEDHDDVPAPCTSDMARCCTGVRVCGTYPPYGSKVNRTSRCTLGPQWSFMTFAELANFASGPIFQTFVPTSAPPSTPGQGHVRYVASVQASRLLNLFSLPTLQAGDLLLSTI